MQNFLTFETSIKPFNHIHPIAKVEFGSDLNSLVETKEPKLTGANSFYFGLHKSGGTFPSPVTICVTNTEGTRACGVIPIVGDANVDFELDGLL